MCVELGNVFSGLLVCLTKNVDMEINTLPRFEVIEKRFYCNFVFAFPSAGSGTVRVSKISQVSSPT